MAAKQICVTQTGSPIGRHRRQRANLVGLGLNKIRRSRILPDTPEIRGRINRSITWSGSSRWRRSRRLGARRNHAPAAARESSEGRRMKLNELAPNPGSRKAPKRIGRGIGSGTGKTAGRGHKGQRARAGSATRTFEGGQMPIYRRLPKHGFKNPFRKIYAPVNLDRLQAAVESGRLDPARPVDLLALRGAGLVNKRLDGVRLLARGELKTALTIEVHSASKAAVSAVEKAGGRLILATPRAAPAADEEPADEGPAAEAAPGAPAPDAPPAAGPAPGPAGE